MNYYDKVLAGIGMLMVIGAVVAFFAGPTAIIGGGALASLLVGHALFVNPPIDSSDLAGLREQTRQQAPGRDASNHEPLQSVAQAAD